MKLDAAADKQMETLIGRWNLFRILALIDFEAFLGSTRTEKSCIPQTSSLSTARK